MTMPRVGLAFVVGSCWLAGCATAPKESPTAPEAPPSTTEREPIPTEGSSPAAGAPLTLPEVRDIAEQPLNICAHRPVQVREEFWEDGGPKVREEVVVDDEGNYIRHGATVHWWSSGNKKLEMTWNCGVKAGTKRTWWEGGERWSEGSFLDGKDHGTWTMWYPDGTKAREFTLDRGAWHGPFTQWYPNGQKQLELEFVNGLQQGPLTRWDQEGNIIYQVDYVDGEEQPMPVAAPPSG